MRLRCAQVGILRGLLLLAAVPLFAQSRTPALAPDSPELYGAFFQFHADFSRWVDQRKASNAQTAQTLDDAAARHFRVDKADLAKMTNVSRQVMADLQKIDQDRRVYVNGRAKYEQFPEPAVLQQFDARRQQAILDGVSRLQQTLSAAGWASLHDYINNTHRLRYRHVSPPR
jgi:hypothetical protein